MAKTKTGGKKKGVLAKPKRPMSACKSWAAVGPSIFKFSIMSCVHHGVIPNVQI